MCACACPGRAACLPSARLAGEGLDVVARPVQVLALASVAALALFASGAAGPWNGTVQRAAVTLALAAEALIAARMLTLKEEPPEPGAAR